MECSLTRIKWGRATKGSRVRRVTHAMARHTAAGAGCSILKCGHICVLRIRCEQAKAPCLFAQARLDQAAPAGRGAATAAGRGGRAHAAAFLSCRPSAPSAARSVPSSLGAWVVTTMELAYSLQRAAGQRKGWRAVSVMVAGRGPSSQQQ